MTKTYIEWIDDQLEFHQTEVARLTIARSVVEEAAAAMELMRGRRTQPFQITEEKEVVLPPVAKAKKVTPTASAPTQRSRSAAVCSFCCRRL